MARLQGNALHLLQSFVHPHVKHVITQTFQQSDESDGRDQSECVAHLRRQAVRIQRGEQVELLTALVDKTFPRECR